MLFNTVPTFKKKDEPMHDMKAIEKRLSHTLTVDLYDLWVEYLRGLRHKKKVDEGVSINKYFLQQMDEERPSNIQDYKDMKAGYDDVMRRYRDAVDNLSRVENSIKEIIETQSLSNDEASHIKRLRTTADKKDEAIAERLKHYTESIKRLLNDEYKDLKAEITTLNKLERLNKNMYYFNGYKTGKPSIRIQRVKTETDAAVETLRKILTDPK